MFSRLNFDCLNKLATFLKLKDIENLDRVSMSDEFVELKKRFYGMRSSFDFSEINPVTYNVGVQTVELFSEKLKSIKISRSDLKNAKHGKDLLDVIFTKCTMLEHITVREIKMDHELLSGLLPRINHLKTLELIDCGITDELIVYYLNMANSLKTLNLAYNPINGSCLSKVTDLLCLSLRGCTKIDPKYFSYVCWNNENLLHLNIDYCNLPVKSTVNILYILKSLEELSICVSDARWNYNNLDLLGYLFCLKKLTIGYSGSIKSQYKEFEKASFGLFMHLLAHDALEFLDIRNMTINSHLCSILSDFQNLKSLIMYGRDDLTDAMLLQLSRSGAIEELIIQSSYQITTNGLVNFATNVPTLKTLDIRDCTRVNEDFCEKISKVLKIHGRTTDTPLRIHCDERHFDAAIIKIEYPLLVLKV